MTDLVGWLLEPSHHTPETEQQRQKRILYELLCDLKGGLFENLTRRTDDYRT